MEFTVVNALLAVALAWLSARFLRLARFYYRALMVPRATVYKHHWLLGDLPDVMDRSRVFHELVPKLTASDRRLHRFMVGPLPLFVVAHPDNVAVILKSSAPKSMFTYSLLLPFIGDGLLVSSGKKWARDRRLLTNAFHFNILRDYTPLLHDSCQVFVEKLAEHAGNAETQNKAFDFSKACCLLTLDVMLRCTMGHESNCQLEDSEYTKGVLEITQLIMQRGTSIGCFLPDFLYFLTENGKKFRSVCDNCHAFSASVIEKRRRELEEDGCLLDTTAGGDAQLEIRKGRTSFVDILLLVTDENGVGMSSVEIRDQVDTFLFGGHDTTSSGLQWTLYYLAKHPHFQQQCREEAQQFSGSDGHVSHEALSKLEFITQCIKESLRMSCPVVFVERQLNEDVTIDQYTLPKGSMANVQIFMLHHNEEIYEDAYSFKPSRFSEENVQSRHPHAFVPFSAGLRNCIGQVLAMNELRLAVGSVLLRFQLDVDPSLPEPLFEDAVVMRAKHGINLLVHTL